MAVTTGNESSIMLTRGVSGLNFADNLVVSFGLHQVGNRVDLGPAAFTNFFIYSFDHVIESLFLNSL